MIKNIVSPISVLERGILVPLSLTAHQHSSSHSLENRSYVNYNFLLNQCNGANYVQISGVGDIGSWP